MTPTYPYDFMFDSFCLPSSLRAHLADRDDPRVQGRCAHQLFDSVVIAFLAVLAGAEGWDAIEPYGKATWLSTFLSLPHGLPFQDTFRRVLSRLDPTQLEARFEHWIASLRDSLDATVVAMDGKTLRGSYDRECVYPVFFIKRIQFSTDFVNGRRKRRQALTVVCIPSSVTSH